MPGTNRRTLLKTGGAISSVPVGLATASGVAAGQDARDAPDHVTISFDEATIQEYQPSLVLEGVEPQPQAFHALHAESTKSSLNAVYGFVKYPYQEGRLGRHDSHLGDHEPIITWYDPTDGTAERVDYACYHWFRNGLSQDALAFETDAQKRPIFRVDPSYHHFYAYDGGIAGERLDVEDLTASIDRWLDEGLDDSLAFSQPYDPWEMLSRQSWWRQTRTNWLDVQLKSFYFNLGIANARETADVQEVSTW